VARKIYYQIKDDGSNVLTDTQWDEIARLQHWYNSEFIWTAGKLGFRLFAVFPNISTSVENDDLLKEIRDRHKELRQSGLSETETIHIMEEEGLIISQKGGYLNGCIASGFTRVAGNEFNAYLVCEFLLKASRVATHARIMVRDEGEFIKTKVLVFFNGSAFLKRIEELSVEYFNHLVDNKQVFSIVNPSKYNDYPVLRNNIPEFNKMEPEEQKILLKDWNWLGYGGNYDFGGNDREGLNLNEKITNFIIFQQNENLEF
jgi:hypothetical protein